MSGASGPNRGTPAVRRLARWLVRRYPRPWRDRYEDEVLSLLDDSSVRWRDAVDLARGLFMERAMALLEPGDRPALTMAVIGILMVLTSLSLALAAYGLGHAARLMTGPPSTSWAILGGVFALSALLSEGFQSVTWQVRNPGSYPWFEQPPVRGRTWWMVATLVGIGMVGWSDPARILMALMMGQSALLVLFAPSRWQRARAAIHRIAVAKHEMKWALMELARCEALEAQGTSAPTAEARATITRIETTRAEGLAALHGMGYRARFRSKDAPARES